MRHYKSVALLHIFCIQLEFRYLPWNHSPAYIYTVSCAHKGHEFQGEILCVTFVILIGKRKRRFGIFFLRKHWHSAQKHAFQMCECFCPELFNFKIGLWDLNIRTHHVGNPQNYLNRTLTKSWSSAKIRSREKAMRKDMLCRKASIDEVKQKKNIGIRNYILKSVKDSSYWFIDSFHAVYLDLEAYLKFYLQLFNNHLWASNRSGS